MTKNIAHRGFSGKYPENTMLAFKRAVEEKCEGIETDLHLTKDGVIVICHDETINRTSNGEGYIKDYTYNELLKFDFGIRFGEEFAGEKIVTLDEFLSFIKDTDIMINLELKNDLIPYEKLEEKTIDKLYQYKLKEKAILSSFNHYSMMKAMEYDASVSRGLLYEATLYEVHEYGKRLKAQALHPYYPSVMDKHRVNKIHESGMLINTYTVNKAEDMRQLIKLGIDGIITNYPNVLREVKLEME